MIYVVEIPHQMPVKVWSAFDRQDFIGRVSETWGGGNYGWDRYDTIDALPYSPDGDDDERGRYAEGVGVITEHGAVIEYWECGEPVFAAPDDAPSEYDYWEEVNGHDLNSQLVFEDAQQALEWLARPENGHRHRGGGGAVEADEGIGADGRGAGRVGDRGRRGRHEGPVGAGAVL